MEEIITIRTSGGRSIEGTLSFVKKESDLTIFVHGLFGHPNEHIFYNTSRIFRHRGLSTFRYALHDQTSCEQFTISQWARDLEEVVRYFLSEFSTINLVGHSLGAIVILMCDLRQVGRVVFWDPSRNAADVVSLAQYNPVLDSFVFENAYRILVPKEMVVDAKCLPKVEMLVKEVRNPIKIITAGKGGFSFAKSLYFDNANVPKCFMNLPNSSHWFDENGIEETLISETLDWLLRDRRISSIETVT